LSVIHYNAVVWIAAFLGIAIAGSFPAVLGISVAMVYSYWDVETRSHALPLSAGGIIVFALVVMILIFKGGRAILSKIPTGIDEAKQVQEQYLIYSPSALSILDVPEKSSARKATELLFRVEKN